MKDSPWGANSYSASQEIHYILWNVEVDEQIHNSLPLVPILSQMLQSTPSDPISSRPVLIPSSQLCLGFHIISCLQVFQPKSCMHFSFLPNIPATCPSHPIFLELLSLIISGKVYKSCASHYAIFSNILLLLHSSKYSPQSPVPRHPWPLSFH